MIRAPRGTRQFIVIIGLVWTEPDRHRKAVERFAELSTLGIGITRFDFARREIRFGRRAT